jgi:stage V sporulation protein AA
MRVFLRPRPLVTVEPGEDVRLGRVADVVGDAPGLADVPVGKGPAPGRYQVLPLPELVRTAAEAAPAADIRVLGAEDVVLRGRREPSRFAVLLAGAAWLLLLVGAAATLLNFHADVNMPAAHRELYRLLTGRTVQHPLLLEIPYSLGVGMGILLFFRPRGGEPGPLELETARYERSLHAYLRGRP